MINNPPEASDVIIASGSYSGDDAADHAIPHGMGIAPKTVIISHRNNDDSIVYNILNHGEAYQRALSLITATTYASGISTTAINDSAFYVSHDAGTGVNANAVTYYWTAIYG